MDTKPHGNTGRRNAAKDGETATSWLQVRVEPSRKARYVRAAQAEDKKLSEWITDTLDARLQCNKKSAI